MAFSAELAELKAAEAELKVVEAKAEAELKAAEAQLQATEAELKAAEAASEAKLKAEVEAKLKAEFMAEFMANLKAKKAEKAELKAKKAELKAKKAKAKKAVPITADHHVNTSFQAIPFEELLEYHRKRLNNPGLSAKQLCDIFTNKTKLIGTEKLIEIYENKKDMDEMSKMRLERLKARFAEETKHNKRPCEDVVDDRPLKR